MWGDFKDSAHILLVSVTQIKAKVYAIRYTSWWSFTSCMGCSLENLHAFWCLRKSGRLSLKYRSGHLQSLRIVTV